MQDIKLLTGPKVDINQIRWRDDNRRVSPANQMWKNVKGIIDQSFKMPNSGSELLRRIRKMHLNAEFGRPARHVDIMALHRNNKMLAPSPDKVREIKFPKVWFDEADFCKGVPLDVNKPIPHWLERDLMMNHMPVVGHNWFMPAGRQRSGMVVRDVKVLKRRECVGGNPFLKLKLPEDFKVGSDNMPRLKEPPVCLKGEPLKVDAADVLKGVWKAPRVVAKPGLPANHPAMKGMHLGRRAEDAAEININRVMRPDMDMHFDFEAINQPIGGLNGAFLDLWRNWAGLDVFAGGIGVGFNHGHIRQEFNHPAPAKRVLTTAEQAAIDANRAKVKLQRQRRDDEVARLAWQTADNVESYIRVCLKLMTEPGANWCQLIANMCDKLKNTYVDKGKQMINDGLGKLGFKLLGSGHFSTAYKGPDGLVYKVNNNYDCTDAWFAYAVNIKCSDLMWCVPNIGDIAHKNSTYCATMELLQPMSLAEYCPYDGLQGAIQTCNVEMVMSLMDISRFDATKLIRLVNQSRADAGSRSRFDIHRENMMFRVDASGRKRPVLTDPLAYGSFEMRKVYAKLTEHQEAASTMCQAA